MKRIALVCISIFVLTNLLYPQDIINETGSEGKFIVRDSEQQEALVIDEGDVTITGALRIEELEEGTQEDKVVVWSTEDKKFKALYSMIPQKTPINASILAADSWTEDGSGNIYRSTGYVGIGTTSPERILDINPSVSGSAQLMRESDSDLFAINLKSLSNRGEILLYKDGAITTKLTGFGDSYFKTGNFGIGTETPVTKLHVKGVDGFLVQGTLYDGVVENLGPGVRMHFIPNKAAFRAGYVTGTHWNNVNIGQYSTAMGYDVKASNWGATAMGFGTTASGLYSTAIGNGTVASGQYSTALGYSTVASGQYSTAMGTGTEAIGIYATTMGFVTEASGDFSTAMGRQIKASGDYSVAIALNNQDGSNVTQNNTMAIMGGKVGIGTLAPASRLHIKQAGDGKNNGLRLESTDGDYWNMQTNNLDDFVIWYNGSTDTRAWISKTDASYHNFSDRRLKQNINIVENALDKVMLLKPVTYELKTNPNSKFQSYGFIAQDVEEIYPEFVSENEGMKGLAYSNFGVVAIKAIQEQQEQIKELKTENEELNQYLVELTKRIETLENR